MSPEYARQTSFGQPVVFGCLGVLACLGTLSEDERRGLERLNATFHRPMFVGVEYLVERSDRSGTINLRLLDGTVQLLTVAVSTNTRVGKSPLFESNPDLAAFFPCREARDLDWDSLLALTEHRGEYQPEGASADLLMQRWGLAGLSSGALHGICWSSYFVGMIAPAKQALFFRVALTLALESPTKAAAHTKYDVNLVKQNQSLQQLQYQAELSRERERFASLKLTAFVRPVVRSEAAVSSLPIKAINDPAWVDKVAVIVGASRGLGACIAIELARRGARVIACARSRPVWIDQLPTPIAAYIIAEELDAGDLLSLESLSTRLKQGFGKVDLLICNAFPAILNLRLEPNAFQRIRSYLDLAATFVLAPIAAFFSNLNESHGCCALISSSAVVEPVRDWPQYVSAKAAAEALLSTAQLQYPATRCITFRPPRMLTEMTNTPGGRAGAQAPEQVAEQIVAWLKQREKLPHNAVINAAQLRTTASLESR